MPHVASHANAHAVSHAHAQCARPPPCRARPGLAVRGTAGGRGGGRSAGPAQAGELATALLPAQAEGDSKTAKPPADPANATLSAPHAEIKAPPAADAAIAALVNAPVNRLDRPAGCQAGADRCEQRRKARRWQEGRDQDGRGQRANGAGGARPRRAAAQSAAVAAVLAPGQPNAPPPSVNRRQSDYADPHPRPRNRRPP